MGTMTMGMMMTAMVIDMQWYRACLRQPLRAKGMV